MSRYDIGMTLIPKWIMLGTDSGIPERPCRLWASAKLTKAELEVRMQPIDIGYWPPPPWYPIYHDAQLTAYMPAEDIVIIEAATWGQCIEALMEQWTPEGGRRGRGPGPLDHADRPAQLPAGRPDGPAALQRRGAPDGP